MDKYWHYVVCFIFSCYYSAIIVIIGYNCTNSDQQIFFIFNLLILIFITTLIACDLYNKKNVITIANEEYRYIRNLFFWNIIPLILAGLGLFNELLIALCIVIDVVLHVLLCIYDSFCIKEEQQQPLDELLINSNV